MDEAQCLGQAQAPGHRLGHGGHEDGIEGVQVQAQVGGPLAHGREIFLQPERQQGVP